MKAVFDTKPTSIYDDEVTSHYQFPKRYLNLVERCIGDRIVLRRPRADGGNLAYFACAVVSHLEPDASTKGMTFAHLRDFMQFDRPVPWTVDGRYWEEELRNLPPARVGMSLRGRSVRALSEADFAAIVAAGLSETLSLKNADRFQIEHEAIVQAEAALHELPGQDQARRTEQVLTNRIIRDASFRGLVCDAYGGRCAVTRLRMLDGRDNPEVQAAHIWSVADGGPDVVQNGIALSGTVHWLFDRHLIAIGDDYRLIVAKGKVPAEFQAVYGQHGTELHLPMKPEEWPHTSFLEKHRAKFFEKNGH
ncbi:HNH endonuclease [Croceibacterium sp. TMG7-5b_MA50]|uniref:HNH endonuclease n=1 Tax=Croceibacterium sp. TMG7-5b_MA50 TaxID=3121290 RepID=UPI003221AC37